MKHEYIGIALETLLGDDDKSLKIWIPELSPFTSDDPSEELVVTPNVINLAKGATPTFNTTVVSHITADYFGNSNISIPDIHTGEQILVYCYDDNHVYYWKEMGRDNKLRSTEHIKFAIASKPSQFGELTDENIYFAELDSRDGSRHIHVHTSQANGEQVGYDIKIDIDKSIVSLLDTEGNYAGINSKDKQIKAENGNGDKITISPNVIDAETTTFNVNAATSNFSGDVNIAGDTNIGGTTHSVGDISTDAGVGPTLATHVHSVVDIYVGGTTTHDTLPPSG